jgi:hypothetical protein
LTATEVGQSAPIAISPVTLHPASIGIASPDDAVLEIDDA